MILSLYRLVGVIGAPVISLYLKRRKARGKEDPARFNERLGIASIARPPGKLVWLHAASVGESLSLLPLIEKLTADRPHFQYLMTTGTVTSAALMAERLPAGVIHQYLPVDRPLYVDRFYDHWQPDLVLWSESDFWPNLMHEPGVRGVPLVLVNGRISPKSFKGWSRYPAVIKTLLKGFALCLGQTDRDAERLQKLGAPVARSVGNLKFAVKPLPVDEKEKKELAQQMGGRRRWMGASTHAGEEQILWQVHQHLRSTCPDLLTVIVPRHPSRGPEIANELRGVGASVALRSAGEMIDTPTDVYVADTLGEMGLFFRLCPLVFMGKSLVDKGGQNPLEAAQLGCTLLYGPYMWNFEEMTERLAERGAAIEVADAEGLTKAMERLQGNEKEAQALASNAKTYVHSQADVLNKVMGELAPFLDKLEKREAAS